MWTLQWFCQSFFLSVEYGQNLHLYFLREGAGGWEGVEEDEDEAWAGGTEDEVTVADGADFLADRGGLVWEGNEWILARKVVIGKTLMKLLQWRMV